MSRADLKAMIPSRQKLFDASAVRQQRRAIVFADLVESVRLMQTHEADAIDRWRRFVAQVREQLLPIWKGRLVRTAGDGLLVECESGRAGVGVSLALHAALAEHNRGRDEDQCMRLRTGVHVAEILFDEHEAYGSGVNLAQRLSSLARPGGTVVSTEVAGELHDGVHAHIEDLGLRYVKHLDEPIRAFAIWPLLPQARGEQILLGRDTTPESTEDLRPTVAVMPFHTEPADPQHDALGHAMADDIIASLSRQGGVRVVSRLSTAAARDVAHDPARLRQLLGAAFVLSGRFYVRGQRIRLSAELSELRGGEVLWTGTHHADIDALFEGQDELVPQLVMQVAQQVLAHELARVRSLPFTSLASYSLYLGASGLLHSLVPADFVHARALMEHLAERHPRQATLQAMLSDWHYLNILQGWAPDVADASQRGQAHAQQALEIDPDLPGALLAAGAARISATRDFDYAQRCYQRALQVNPNHPMAWARLSETQRVAGELDAAQQSAERAMVLSPLDPQRFIFESFAASVALEAHRFADAQRHARASLRRHLLFAPPHRILICALWMSGQEDAARLAAAECLRCIPGITVSGRMSVQRGLAPSNSPYARALLAAGLPP
jgi:adenylate cyclase